MKAVQINKYGGTEVLEIRDVPPPTPSDEQVLVEVYAAGLNPFDAKLHSGAYKTMMPLTFPFRMGDDFAGVVTSSGEEVYGSAMALGRGSGSYAEMVVANQANVTSKPTSATFEQAAGLPVAGVSAVAAIEEHIKLQAGQKILIHGGAGGIGHMAIQLAKSKGAYVATTVRASAREFVISLGADQVIDYKTQRFEELVKDFDAALDTVGREVTNRSFSVLRKGGILVSMTGAPDQALVKQSGVTAIGQNTKTDSVHLKRLAELVDSGAIRVHLAKVFPLEGVGEAFDLLESGHPKGKVVIKIRG